MPYRPENDPFKQEYVAPAQPASPPEPKPRRPQIAWRRGAAMMADGEELPAICAALGIDEERFWRHMRSSPRFGFLIDQARERRRLQAQMQLERRSREAMLRMAERIDRLAAEQLDWFCRQAGLGDAVRHDVAESLRQAAAAPPNMAFRKRIAAERARMDAEVARTKAALARHEARQNAGQAPPAAPDPAQQNQTLNDAKPSQTGAGTSPAEPSQPPQPNQARRPPHDDLAGWQPPPRPPRPPAAPPPRSRAELYGTIVDLPGPDMHRIRYAKDPDPDEEMD